jgi:hypothetical protein
MKKHFLDTNTKEILLMVYTRPRAEHYQHWHDVNQVPIRLDYDHIHQPMLEIPNLYGDVNMDNATKPMDTNPNRYRSINH